MNLVAADVSPLHLNSEEVRADSRRLLRFRGSKRESSRGILSLKTIVWSLVLQAALAVSAAEPPPDFLWSRQAVGSTNSDIGYALAADTTGNVYVCGSFAGTINFGGNLISSGLTDVFVAKYDGAGNLLWARKAGGTGYDEGRGIAVDAAGNAYVTGIFQGAASFGATNLTSSGNSDVFLAQYDAAGTIIWARRAGGNADDEAHALALDGAGNLYLTGTFDGNASFGSFAMQNNSHTSDLFIAKTDNLGNFLWVAKAGGNTDDDSRSISLDAATNVYVTGSFAGTATFGTTNLTARGTNGLNDAFLAKYSGAGTFLWAQQAGGNGSDNGYSVTTDNGGNVIVTGSFSSPALFGATSLTGNGTDIFVAKYDSAGSMLWVRRAGGNDAIYGDSGRGVTTDGAGNIYVTGFFSGSGNFGSTNLPTSGFDDVFVAKYDNGGNLLWVRQAGGVNLDVANAIALDGSANIFATGFFYDTASFGGVNLTSAGFEDVFVCKLGTAPPPPSLTTVISGAKLILSWPGPAVGYILEAADDLSNATNWAAVANGTNGVAVPLSGARRFFRLRKL